MLQISNLVHTLRGPIRLAESDRQSLEVKPHLGFVYYLNQLWVQQNVENKDDVFIAGPIKGATAMSRTNRDGLTGWSRLSIKTL